MEKYTYTESRILPATAVVQSINMGFTPASVRIDAYSSPTITNGILTAGTYVGSLEWYDTMADASALKTLAAGTGSLVTTNGVSKAGSADSIKGVKVGIETSCNVANYGWVISASRN